VKLSKVLAVGTACLVATMLAGCGSDDSPRAASATTAPKDTATTVEVNTGPGTPAPQPLAEHTKITASIPFAGVEAFVQLPLAVEMGEFAKENLEVDIATIPPPDALVQLQSKRLWVTPAGIGAGMLNAISAGSDLALMGSLSGFTGLPTSKGGFWARSDLVGPDGKMDPCSFKGKTVSFGGPAGLSATNTLYFSEYIKKCHLTVLDVTVSPVGGPDLLAALQNGSVDVGYLSDPIWKDPDTKGYAKLVIPFGTDATGGYVMGPLRKDHPEVAAAIMRALVRTTRTYLQGDYHKDPKTRAALIKVLGFPESTLDATPSLPFDPDMRFSPRFVTDVAEPLQDIWRAAKLLSFNSNLPSDRYLDLSVLDQVAPVG
jgi:NitT/TauT family transport system substrate-binding protein